ncbi:MAG: histidine phosphatase family protein [Bacteroidota bacterium]|nr:histidine phosphatase family protein [Bacteroidota bacterium]
MKHLFLIRHAKASKDYLELTDFERPLTVKGRQDAEMMGKFLKSIPIYPDLIVSSTANRAITTARIFARELAYPLLNIRIKEKIYEAWVDDLINILQEIEPVYNTVLMVGHNPGFQMLAESFGEFEAGHLNTSGIIQLSCMIENWSEINEINTNIVNYFSPKTIKPTINE